MSKELAKKLPTYEDACRFLARMVDIEPVKEIKNQADGVKKYAIAAKDPELLERAIRIRYEACKNLGRIIREMQKRGELATKGKDKKNKDLKCTDGSTLKTLEDLGFSRNDSSHYQWLLDLPSGEYELRVSRIIARVIGSLDAVFRQALREERKKILLAKSEIAPGLHLGDFRELSPKVIKTESIDLVFIDPPYDEDAVPLYGDAAEEAKRILKPGGSLVSYCGHFILPQILPLMEKHLKFLWICAAVHSGPSARLEYFGIRAGFKPLLWFVKDYRADTQTFVDDVVVGTGRDKEFHEWQQALNEAEHFIEPLTLKGGSVVDFFAGSATTLIAARNLGRKSIGFEIDPDHAARAATRLVEYADAKRK